MFFCRNNPTNTFLKICECILILKNNNNNKTYQPKAMIMIQHYQMTPVPTDRDLIVFHLAVLGVHPLLLL